MLTLTRVAPYLLQRGLIAERAIVDGELTIVEVMRRNRTFQVVSTPGPSYFLKQGLDRDAVATVAREAAIYRLFDVNPASRENSADHAGGARREACDGNTGSHIPFTRLPHFYDYDAAEQLLILELLPGAESVRDYLTRRGRLARWIGAELGAALAALHRQAPLPGRDQRPTTVEAEDALPGEGVGGYTSPPILVAPRPWVLWLHHPTAELVRKASAAALHLIEIIQSSTALCDALDELRHTWRAEALIHGDIKWENCLMSRPDSARQTRSLNLVDWEFAGAGDPAWDVGSVFMAYLGSWLWSVPITGEDPPDRFLELARYPLETMQPGIRAFWQTYAREMRLDPPEAFAWLLRSVAYSAARMIQTAYERMQFSSRVTGNAVCMIQLSLNLLQRPYEGITHLLGIPLEGGE